MKKSTKKSSQNSPEETLNEIVLSALAPTKSNVQFQASKIVSVIQSGIVNPLDAAFRLTAIEKMVEQAKKDIHLDVLFEAEKWKGKVEMHGGTITIKESGVKYDYSSSAEWRDLDDQIKHLTESRKRIEEAMKRIPAGKLLVDEETGLTLQGANKTSTTTYEVRLGK